MTLEKRSPIIFLIWVPAAILAGHLLFEILGEGVDDFWCSWDVLVEWHVRRWVIERVANGIDAAVNLVDAGEGLDNLAVVGEVRAYEVGLAVR